MLFSGWYLCLINKVEKVEKKAGKMAFFKKVIDKLAGGPPNEKVLEERKNWSFLSRYKSGFCLPVALTVFFLGGYLIGFTLNPVPKYSSLPTLYGEIIGARRASPEFVVRLADGQELNVEWPGAFYLLGNPKTNGPNSWENEILKGCQAKIKYTPMRFVPVEHLRIWELQCQNIQVRVSYDEIIRGFHRSSESYRFIFSLGICFVYIVSFVTFLREKRGHL